MYYFERERVDLGSRLYIPFKIYRTGFGAVLPYLAATTYMYE